MYLVAIAWLYVALMMSLAEAAHANGSVLGAIITFILYGVGPVALVLYLLATPQRRKAIRAREAAEWQAQRDAAAQAAARDGESVSAQPDAGGQSPTATQNELVTPIRKEP